MDAATSEKRGLLAAGGSVVAAAATVASACCWLPLLLVAFGASAAGVSATFERFRPIMLGSAAVLLAVGFCLVYFRKKACAPDEACTAPRPRIERLNRVMLWVAALAVLAFGAFPKYVGVIGGGNGSLLEPTPGTAIIELRIDGMTCEACTVHIRRELLDVEGVQGATVEYERAKATVSMDDSVLAANEDLIEAVERAGYKGAVVEIP